MRRFEELKLLRSRTPLFGLSWTVMHQIDAESPLFGVTFETLYDLQVEIIILLSGTDDDAGGDHLCPAFLHAGRDPVEPALRRCHCADAGGAARRRSPAFPRDRAAAGVTVRAPLFRVKHSLTFWS